MGMGNFIPGDGRGLSSSVLQWSCRAFSRHYGKAAQAHSKITPVQFMAMWATSSSSCTVAMPVALGTSTIGAEWVWMVAACFVSINCGPCTWVASGNPKQASASSLGWGWRKGDVEGAGDALIKRVGTEALSSYWEVATRWMHCHEGSELWLRIQRSVFTKIKHTTLC